MPSRLKDEKPVSVNVTMYVPGMSSMMRYSPRSSVTALRTFSMRTGLDASTVTPGSTAPDVSVTTPAMVAELVPCPWAGNAPRNTPTTTAATQARILSMSAPPSQMSRHYLEHDADVFKAEEAGEPDGIKAR